MDARYENWSTSRKYTAAIDKVEGEGWSQTEAAERFGISRSNLNRRLKARREERDTRQTRQAELAAAETAGRSAGDADEPAFERDTRELGREELEAILGDYELFLETYFTDWICPDCSVHHEAPEFHKEIWEALVDPDVQRLLINIPPYHSKSTVVSVFDTVRKICLNPDFRTAIVSKTEVFAKAFVRQVAEILSNEELYDRSKRSLIEDFGPFKRSEGQQTWNDTMFYVANRKRAEKDPTVMALGIDGQIYGRRFDEIKFDDVATVKNSRNPDLVAQMISHIDKEHMSRVGKNGRVVFVGTRVNPGDIYSTYQKRSSYRVIKYPCVIDEVNEETLWPDHFPYRQAQMHREEMSSADFQLIFQNVDVPGLGASFSQEMLDDCKDPARPVGHFDPQWKLVAGLDPAGGNKDSGYTAMTVLGIDLQTGKRYVVDQVAVKSMKAPQMMEQMKTFTLQYPISEWRVESNGLQSQLVQYNTEIVQWMANRGVKVTPHFTHGNKWDPQFGVETIAAVMHAGLLSIPWGGAPSAKLMQPLIDEFISFPMGLLSDRVMSFWFADLGCRDLLNRANMPLFDSRMRAPKRIKRRRTVANFETGQVSAVPLNRQYPGAVAGAQLGGMRKVVGRPHEHGPLVDQPPPPDEKPEAVNVDLESIWQGRQPGDPDV